MLSFAFGVALGAVVLGGYLLISAGDDDRTTVSFVTGTQADDWKVEVGIAPERLGSARFEVAHLRRDRTGWLQHDLIAHNLASLPVAFDDNRDSAFLRKEGRRRLAVSTEGCGFAQSDKGGRWGADICLLYLRVQEVEPGKSVLLHQIRVERDAFGMAPPVTGDYTFRLPVAYWIDPKLPSSDLVDSKPSEEGTIEIVYRLTRRG